MKRLSPPGSVVTALNTQSPKSYQPCCNHAAGRITPRELAHAKRMYRARKAARKALDKLVANKFGAWNEVIVQGGKLIEFVLGDNIDDEDGNSF